MKWSGFSRKANAWAVRHPWRYAAILSGSFAILWFALNYFGSRAMGRSPSLVLHLIAATFLGLFQLLLWGWLFPRARRLREQDDAPSNP